MRKRVFYYFKRDERLLLAAGAALFIFIFSLVGAWKLATFKYNALDLAIFNQVFWNTISGRLFELSIHPHLSLGDHFELFILLLAPFYAIAPQPGTLIVLQNIVLALGAIPVFLLAKRRLSGRWPLFVALAYLFNPFLWNAALFEFHIVVLVVPLALTAIWFYETERFRPFLAVAGLTLLVREDAALIIILFGLLAFYDRRRWRWVLSPAILGTVWFILATRLIAFFAPDGNYKFRVYYEWLGATPREALAIVISEPSKVLAYLFTAQNGEMLLGLGAVFLFLPFFAPRLLILSIFVFAEFLLGSGGVIVLQTHYAALFFAPLMAAGIDGLARLLHGQIRWAPRLFFDRRLIALIFAVGTIYNALAFGPVLSGAKDREQIDRAAAQKFIRSIPAEASVAASDAFLPTLSNRERLYPTYYLFLGKQQLSTIDYPKPRDLDATLIDANDLLVYSLHFPSGRWASKLAKDGPRRMRDIIAQNNLAPAEVRDTLVIFRRNGEKKKILYQSLAELPADALSLKQDGVVRILAWKPSKDVNDRHFSIFLTSTGGEIKKETALLLEFLPAQGKDDRAEAEQKVFPITYGFYPPREWPSGEIIEMNFWLSGAAEGRVIRIIMVEVESGIELARHRGVTRVIDRMEPLGNAVTLNFLGASDKFPEDTP